MILYFLFYLSCSFISTPFVCSTIYFFPHLLSIYSQISPPNFENFTTLGFWNFLQLSLAIILYLLSSFQHITLNYCYIHFSYHITFYFIKNNYHFLITMNSFSLIIQVLVQVFRTNLTYFIIYSSFSFPQIVYLIRYFLIFSFLTCSTVYFSIPSFHCSYIIFFLLFPIINDVIIFIYLFISLNYHMQKKCLMNNIYFLLLQQSLNPHQTFKTFYYRLTKLPIRLAYYMHHNSTHCNLPTLNNLILYPSLSSSKQIFLCCSFGKLNPLTFLMSLQSQNLFGL
ncbi:hypothetical protein FGO68_gene16247 [Halteria grandinella]|uniref:Uncharacterized protein n=1 Tax=Halteria grandinella TaxID=5974 RepID=A0A8J8SXA7_HALGN|nr:hypothetical protein FGO68_gene16247 [Halteria grandinella]